MKRPGHMAPLLAILIVCACAGDGGVADSGAAAAHDTARAVNTPAPPDACVRGPLRGDGVGQVRLGTTLDSLRRACRVVRDTIVPADEGLTARVLTVASGGDSVSAEVDGDSVWRIAVTDPTLRTGDSLGVGSTVADLLRLEGVTGIQGEGRLFAIAPSHCGLSFQLDAKAGGAAQSGGGLDLRRLPADTRVTRVLVTGCRR